MKTTLKKKKFLLKIKNKINKIKKKNNINFNIINSPKKKVYPKKIKNS